MGMRELLMGKAEGKSAWRHLMDRWSRGKRQEAWRRAFSQIDNRLGLKPGDLVEIGFLDKVGWKVETVLFFRTPPGDPDYVRYALARIGDNEVAMLEAMPGGAEGEPHTLSLFKLLDEFELDEELIGVLDDEDVLRRTDVDEQGREVEIDYQKDFVTEATVEIFDAEDRRQVQVFTYNYFAPGAGGGEEGEHYLCVEVVEEARWMNFYRGERLDSSDVLALGTA